MLLSKSCEYAIRAALHLAVQAPTSYIAVREISEALGIPYPFLAKIVQTLIQAGLFTSLRGPHGGVNLGRTPDQIRLSEIVVAVDGPEVFQACVLGLPGCGNQKPCPLHDQWAPLRTRTYQLFAAATLADTAARMHAGDFRLATLTAPS